MQNSELEDQEKQDQSKSSVMKDSTSMTIEFLRARLLSERSVSKAARQRADQLAKKVVELEEQLKIATEQRKKAEKATSEVLAILENNGVSDFSEVIDSGSDQDGINSKPEENVSTGGKSIGDEEEEISKSSRSEVDTCDSAVLEALSDTGRSLSWKGSSSYSNSRGKSLKKSPDQQVTKHKLRSFTFSGGSVPKQNLGKSCRQIKRREIRSASEPAIDVSSLLVTEEEGTTFVSGGKSKKEVSAAGDDLNVIVLETRSEHTSGDVVALKVFLGAEVPSSLERTQTGSAVVVTGSYRDVDMERVLEQQAQLIGQYEAEENAQREWEEKQKFRDASCFTAGSCEAENQPFVPEERDKNKPSTIFSCDQGLKSEKEQVSGRDMTVSKTLTAGLTPSDLSARDENSRQAGCSEGQKQSGNTGPPIQGKTGTRSKSKQKLVSGENNSDFNFQPSRPGSTDIQQFQQKSTDLDVVLESLQLAKLAIKYELNKTSPSSSNERAVVAVGGNRARAEKSMDFPVSCAGLFRLPSDSQGEVSPGANFMNVGENLPRRLLDTGTSIAAGDRHPSPYMNMGAGISNGDRYPSSRMNTGAGIYGDPYLKPYMETGSGHPTANRNVHLYSDLGTRVPTNGQFPNPYSDGRIRIPGGDRYSVYDDRSRSNMR